MSDTYHTVEDVLRPIEEGESMWPHNSHAVEDTAVEMAVLVALDQPTYGHQATPVMRRATTALEPVRRLFDVLFGRMLTYSDRDVFTNPCDRCLRDVQPRHSLWISAGSSVIDLHCCDRCRGDLDADFIGPSALIWS